MNEVEPSHNREVVTWSPLCYLRDLAVVHSSTIVHAEMTYYDRFWNTEDPLWT